MGYQDPIAILPARFSAMWSSNEFGWGSGWRVFLITAVTLLLSLLVRFFVKLYYARKIFWNLQKQGMPMPPGHSTLFGHLLLVKSVMDSMPKGAHKNLSFAEITRRFSGESEILYLDLWPLGEPFLVVTSPMMAQQATQTNSSLAFERPVELLPWFRPIAGGPNLFDLPGKDWRPWRAVFNKGFSAEHLLSLVPNMVQETLVYRETLRRHARERNLFHLDPTTLRYTMDLIGRTVLNTRLQAQQGYNTLADCMINQIKWHMVNRETDPLNYFNPIRPMVQWWNGRQMDQYVGRELDQRYREFRADRSDTRTKAAIDLVLQAYVNDRSKATTEHLDTEFRAFAIRQIRLFVFAGHDSTSSTICYMFHLLSQRPDALSQLRAEHDSVFGTDLSVTPSLLAEQPHLLNALPYTNAVIKETMRLFPAATGIRRGAPGADLVDEQGNRYPTDHALVWIMHPAMQRSPKHWPRPDDFLPERWLVGPEHELYPSTKGAWRPFEYGPRNCIGQGLVMVEMRVVLVMIAREIDFVPAYDEWDRLHPKSGPRVYRGDRAYQIEQGAAHPADHYPCRVFISKAAMEQMEEKP
ncbi:MAG: Nucleolar protein 58 [Watsoniomyces obsoletus]|nr:MAG: Nucleolar protein 58 [Watsoniomyces obsoletus]